MQTLDGRLRARSDAHWEITTRTEREIAQQVQATDTPPGLRGV
jgi:hypothetical protein